MRRLTKATGAAAAALAAVALAASGCGVQPTGVNVAQAAPFTASGSSTSQEPSQVPEPFQMVLYFIPETGGLPRQTVRASAKPATGINDLLQQLKTPNDPTLVTYVPEDLQLIPTSNAHQYTVESDTKVGGVALDQLACTFSYYWRQHPDKGAAPSVSFIMPYGGNPTQWSDCAYLLGSSDAPKASAVVPSGG